MFGFFFFLIQDCINCAFSFTCLLHDMISQGNMDNSMSCKSWKLILAFQIFANFLVALKHFTSNDFHVELLLIYQVNHDEDVNSILRCL